eukprot:GDKH01024241.1.p1 GENE.GDKH01024241.1~~GDKH01024241.1.p1  ORF type:complete len:175 (-),score=30.30 GDKH01024241.1:150-674(-)
MHRQKPNILILGTPGTGKTTLSRMLAERLGMQHIEVGEWVREKRLYKEWDDEMNCSIFDDDMVVDALEPVLEQGGCIVDFHSCDFLPTEWFDRCFVLRCDNEELWKRLEKRGYPEHKIQKNVECEIFQTVLDEAREMFEEEPDCVKELQSENLADLDNNLNACEVLVREAVQNV